jgi:calcium-dependent protein kinase
MAADELARLRAQFSSLDTDGNGVLSKEELSSGISGVDALSLNLDVDEIMKQCDADGSETLTFDEFIQAAASQEHLVSKSRLEYVFNHFDSDNSGKISTENLRNMLGSHINDEVFQQVIEEVD